MNIKQWIIGGGVLALLLGAGAATWAAASPPVPPLPDTVPTEAVRPATVKSSGGSWNITAPDKRWQYTRADYDYALALMTPGYETQTLAQFNKTLLDWTDEESFHKGEERLERLLCSYLGDKPNADFIHTTLRASLEEVSTHHYGGSCTRMAPTWWGNARRVRTEDVFGDQVPVFEAEAYYVITYRVGDEEKLTVGERDKLFAAYETAMTAYLNARTEAELKSEEAMETALAKELQKLDRQYATANCKLTSELNDYYVTDYRDWH